LFLDITSVLLQHSLNLLEKVESAFSKIAVPARLAAWLQAEVDSLQPGQPELGYSGNLVAGMGQEVKELLE
jgi:hypothetical protein